MKQLGFITSEPGFNLADVVNFCTGTIRQKFYINDRLFKYSTIFHISHYL